MNDVVANTVVDSVTTGPTSGDVSDAALDTAVTEETSLSTSGEDLASVAADAPAETAAAGDLTGGSRRTYRRYQ